MRTISAAVALATVTILSAPAAVAAPSATAAALHAGDWHRAAELGASAADVIRALQARGRFTDMAPTECVVTIAADNAVDAVALKPLPPLDPADAKGSTARLSGTGFAFTAKPGAITLYPAYAQASFAPTGRSRP